MDYQDTNLDEREISIFDLFMYVVRRYRSIILVGLVCGIIVCGISFVKTRMAGPEDYEAYNKTMELYERNQELIKLYEGKIEEADKFLAEQSLTGIGNSKIYAASISIYVESTGSKVVNSDICEAISNNIILTLEKGIDWKSLSQKYDIDEEYIKNFVDISKAEDTSAVTISVLGSSADKARSLLSDLRTLISDNQEYLLDSYDGFYLKEKDYSTYIDNSWFNNVEENIKLSIEEYRTQIEKLNAVAMPTEPGYFPASKAVKLFAIGFAVGTVVMAVFYFVAYLLNDSIREDDELSLYYGFVRLGTFSVKPVKNKNNCFDRYLLKKQYGDTEDEYVYERIAENIGMIASKDEKVLVSGTIDKNKLEELYNKLSSLVKNCELILGDNINSSNETLRKLKDVDSVILIEERGVSKLKEVNREIDSIKNCSKKVLGYIQY